MPTSTDDYDSEVSEKYGIEKDSISDFRSFFPGAQEYEIVDFFRGYDQFGIPEFEGDLEEMELPRGTSGSGLNKSVYRLCELDTDECYIPTDGSCLYKCLLWIAKQVGIDLSGDNRAKFHRLAISSEKKGVGTPIKCYLPVLKKICDEFPNFPFIPHCTVSVNKNKYTYQLCNKRQSNPSYNLSIGYRILLVRWSTIAKIQKKTDKLSNTFKQGHYIVVKRTGRNYPRIEKICKSFNFIEKDIDVSSQRKYKLDHPRVKSRFVAVYDLEAYVDNQSFVPYAAGTCIVDLEEFHIIEGSYKHFIGLDCYYKMLDYLSEFCRSRKFPRIQLWAHNGGNFDHRFALFLDKIHYISSIKTCGTYAKLVISYNSIVFVMKDTLKFFQASLKTLTHDTFKVAHPKMDYAITIITKDNFMDYAHEWVPYLEWDVLGLAEVLIEGERLFNSIGRSMTISLTLAGIAKSLLQSNCYMNDIFCCNEPSVAAVLRKSIKGGRIFHNKTLFESKDDDDYLICIDGNSLYPSAMAKFNYPVGRAEVYNDTDEEGKSRIRKVTNQLNNGTYDRLCILRCDVIPSKLYQPILPYKDPIDGNIFTTEPYNDVLTSVDVLEAVRMGYRIENVDFIYEWSKARPIFRDMVSRTYDLRKQARSEGNSLLEYMYKINLNSCFGKLCERIEFEKHKGTVSTKDDLKRVDILPNGQKDYISRDISFGPFHLGAFVLSYSRVIMNNIIHLIDGFNTPKIYYGDTDSIYIHRRDLEPINHLQNGDLGGWKNDYSDGTKILKAMFMGYKKYCLIVENKGKKSMKIKFNGLNKTAMRDGAVFITNELSNPDDSQIDVETKFEATKNVFLSMIRGSPFKVELEKWERSLRGVFLKQRDVLFSIRLSRRRFFRFSDNPLEMESVPLGLDCQKDNSYLGDKIGFPVIMQSTCNEEFSKLRTYSPTSCQDYGGKIVVSPNCCALSEFFIPISNKNYSYKLKAPSERICFYSIDGVLYKRFQVSKDKHKYAVYDKFGTGMIIEEPNEDSDIYWAAAVSDDKNYVFKNHIDAGYVDSVNKTIRNR